MAEKMGFHYIKEPEKWYDVSSADFCQHKVLVWAVVMCYFINHKTTKQQQQLRWTTSYYHHRNVYYDITAAGDSAPHYAQRSYSTDVSFGIPFVHSDRAEN